MQELDSEGLGSHLCRTAATSMAWWSLGFLALTFELPVPCGCFLQGWFGLVIRLLSWLSVSVSCTFICKVVVVPTP